MNRICIYSLLLLSPMLAAWSEARPIPINVAEAIIEVFWSTEISGFEEWQVDPGVEQGLIIHQNWSAVDYEWARKPERGPALRMSKRFGVDCSGYDTLIVKLVAPGRITVTATTDQGERKAAYSAKEKEWEYGLALEGAQRIDSITLEIEAAQDGPAAGWLRWIGLQNSAKLADYLARWDYSGLDWAHHLQPEGHELEFAPRYGIFLTPEELRAKRDEHGQAAARGEVSSYAALAEQARGWDFEAGIHEFAQSGGDDNFHSRVRDRDMARLPGNEHLAVAGLVLEDGETLRAAARYALCLAASEHWEHGFMSHFTPCPWEDRAFRRSSISKDIAVILDVAGNALTEAGRLYLMRRLAEEGIGPINYVTWRHEYIFGCNQLAYFNTGRMYAYLALEREWPRVKPYTDLAYQDTVNNLNAVILPDGGYLEGPSYLCPTVRENYCVLKHYARARGLDLAGITPACLKRTGRFAEVVASTTEDDVIAICDAGPDLNREAVEVLADLLPESYWVTLLNKRLKRDGRTPLARPGPPLPAFVALPDTGHIASVRRLDGLEVKLLIMGHHAKADHTHEDKGSFVLEFAGEAFAMDLGICEYDEPIHHQYKQAQRHNMLVPVGTAERAHPLRPIPFDVKPTGQGDEQSVEARIDATPGWGPYYKKWVRSWDSPSPDELVIRDEYELAQGDGVAFYWQTQLPYTVDANQVRLTGERGVCTITAPEDCTVKVEELPLAEGDSQRRISIVKAGQSGTMVVCVSLAALP